MRSPGLLVQLPAKIFFSPGPDLFFRLFTDGCFHNRHRLWLLNNGVGDRGWFFLFRLQRRVCLRQRSARGFLLLTPFVGRIGCRWRDGSHFLCFLPGRMRRCDRNGLDDRFGNGILCRCRRSRRHAARNVLFLLLLKIRNTILKRVDVRVRRIEFSRFLELLPGKFEVRLFQELVCGQQALACSLLCRVKLGEILYGIESLG